MGCINLLAHLDIKFGKYIHIGWRGVGFPVLGAAYIKGKPECEFFEPKIYEHKESRRTAECSNVPIYQVTLFKGWSVWGSKEDQKHLYSLWMHFPLLARRGTSGVRNKSPPQTIMHRRKLDGFHLNYTYFSVLLCLL